MSLSVVPCLCLSLWVCFVDARIHVLCVRSKVKSIGQLTGTHTHNYLISFHTSTKPKQISLNTTQHHRLTSCLCIFSSLETPSTESVIFLSPLSARADDIKDENRSNLMHSNGVKWYHFMVNITQQSIRHLDSCPRSPIQMQNSCIVTEWNHICSQCNECICSSTDFGNIDM